MEVLQNLNEGFFKPGNLKTVLDTANETNRIYLSAHVLKQATDEGLVMYIRDKLTKNTWIDTHEDESLNT